MSGKQILDLIEQNNPRAEGDGVIWPSSIILQGVTLKALEKVAQETTSYTFTICLDAHTMDRATHTSYLESSKLKTTERFVLALGAALYRDEKKFPKKREDIGTERDQGDLFKGLAVRDSSGALLSYADGVSGSYDDFDIGVGAVRLLVVAGSPN